MLAWGLVPKLAFVVASNLQYVLGGAGLFRIMPAGLKPVSGGAIIMTSTAAVALNARFDRTSRQDATEDASLAAQAAEHT